MPIVIIFIAILMISLSQFMSKVIDKMYEPTIRMDYTPKSGYDDPHRYKK